MRQPDAAICRSDGNQTPAATILRRRPPPRPVVAPLSPRRRVMIAEELVSCPLHACHPPLRRLRRRRGADRATAATTLSPCFCRSTRRLHTYCGGGSVPNAAAAHWNKQLQQESCAPRTDHPWRLLSASGAFLRQLSRIHVLARLGSGDSPGSDAVQQRRGCGELKRRGGEAAGRPPQSAVSTLECCMEENGTKRSLAPRSAPPLVLRRRAAPSEGKYWLRYPTSRTGWRASHTS